MSAVRVTLRGRVQSPRASWDGAAALGRAVLTARPDIDTIEVVVNNNRRRVLAWGGPPERFRLSVHWSLVPHIDGVLAVISGQRERWPPLRQKLLTDPAGPAPPRVQPAGQVFDLEVLQREQRAWVDTPIAAITWGRWPNRPPRTQLRLGSCSGGAAPLVRIHPVLDHDSVPRWFVAFVVFHELLHIAVPPEVGPSGRRRVHPPAFLRLEAKHPDWGRAQAWERANIGTLITRVCARLAAC